MNIYNKIYEIMNEYDTLLNEKEKSINKPKNIYKEDLCNQEKLNKDKNEYYNNIDDFFKYIFNNININLKNDNVMNNNSNNDSNNDSNNNLNNNSNNNSNNDLNNDSNNDSNNDDTNNNDLNKEDINESIINKFIKDIYKKIILKCHPDKNGDAKMFIKCKEYYENKFLIGLLYIGFLIKYKLPELNKVIINKILFEIRVIQEKIIYLKFELKNI
jgi:hypothetical protein